jgi:hypothetical protein
METAYELFSRIYVEAERASCCVLNALFCICRPHARVAATIELPDFLRIGFVKVAGAPHPVVTADQFGIATGCVEAFEDFFNAVNETAAARGLTRDGGPALPDRPCSECGDPLCGYYAERSPFLAGIVGLPSSIKMKVIK